jgi:formate-dependent nitrite reductase membrane component NrfD
MLAMQRIFGFIGHLVGALLKGYFFTGMAAVLVCAVALFLTEPDHRVTSDTSPAFGLVIAFLAGVLGAVALIYHLSHLDSLHHAAQHYSARRSGQQHP